MEYTHPTAGGNITVKWSDGLVDFEIHVASTISDLLVQDLLDAIRAAEDSAVGQGFGPIIVTSGKDSLGTGVSTGITLKLLGSWRVYSTKTSGVFRVFGGNLLRDDGGDPFRPNNLITYQVIQSAASTIVTTGGGGAGSFTANDRTLLTEVHSGVAPLTNAIRDAVATLVIEGTLTLRTVLRRLNAIIRGAADFDEPVAGTRRIRYRNEAGEVEATHQITSAGRTVE